MPSLEEIMTAEFGFGDIKDLAFKVYTHPHIEGILQPVREFIESLSPLAWGSLICLVALVFTFFGKKLIMIPILGGSYCLAYAVGATYIAPKLISLASKLPFEIPIDIGVVGIVLGVIAAILCVPCYFAAIALGGGYSVYLVVYPVASALLGDSVALVVGLGVALAAVVAIFIFRKWVEMGATAICGAYFFMLGVFEIYPLLQIVNYIIWFAVAIAGIVVQIKTRRRY